VGKKEEDQRRLSAWSQFPLCLCAQLSFARCFTRHIRHVIGEIHNAPWYPRDRSRELRDVAEQVESESKT